MLQAPAGAGIRAAEEAMGPVTLTSAIYGVREDTISSAMSRRPGRLRLLTSGIVTTQLRATAAHGPIMSTGTARHRGLRRKHMRTMIDAAACGVAD